MILFLQILVALLLAIGSALVLWWAWRCDQVEDLGRVSPGYMKERQWWMR